MNVLALILVGGQASRLSILGEKRVKPNGVQIWQPYQDRRDQDWYRGTADALYQNRNLIAESGCDRVLVLTYNANLSTNIRYQQYFWMKII